MDEELINHHLSVDDSSHSTWDNELDPACTIESGDVVRFDCLDATGGQLNPESTIDDVATVDVDRVHTLTGPVAVAGAQPGDVLEIEILDIDHEGWGYTLVLPGQTELGLLSEEFPEPALFVWEFDDGVAHFVDDIEIPINPFPGVMGVAPAEDGSYDTLPPRSTGGNMDTKHLTVGSTLSLPVAVEDALFSIGDCHAAQGDGEVCGTGIEAPMTVTCRLTLRSDRSIEQPQFETTGPYTATGRDEPMYATTGVDDDLMDATKAAIRYMIDHLCEERGLDRHEAYMLCSVAVDLKLSEVVGTPNWVVSAHLPESIFPAATRRSVDEE